MLNSVLYGYKHTDLWKLVSVDVDSARSKKKEYAQILEKVSVLKIT